jgi:hypothetical protein
VYPSSIIVRSLRSHLRLLLTAGCEVAVFAPGFGVGDVEGPEGDKLVDGVVGRLSANIM